MKKTWTQLLEGETLEDLFDSVYETVESNKLGGLVKIYAKSKKLMIFSICRGNIYI